MRRKLVETASCENQAGKYLMKRAENNWDESARRKDVRRTTHITMLASLKVSGADIAMQSPRSKYESFASRYS